MLYVCYWLRDCRVGILFDFSCFRLILLLKWCLENWWICGKRWFWKISWKIKIEMKYFHSIRSSLYMTKVINAWYMIQFCHKSTTINIKWKQNKNSKINNNNNILNYKTFCHHHHQQNSILIKIEKFSHLSITFLTPCCWNCTV